MASASSRRAASLLTSLTQHLHAHFGLTALMAVEQEFFLAGASPSALHRRVTAEAASSNNLPLFVAPDGSVVVAESGPDQFEVATLPTPPLEAADNAVRLRQMIRKAAGNDARADFSAVHVGKDGGMHSSGLHVHVSLHHVSDGGSVAGPASGPVSGLFVEPFCGAKVPTTLRQAIAGCLDLLPQSLPIFSPSPASLARFLPRPRSRAPQCAAWGYNVRWGALRVPAGDAANLRFEHRVASADADPHEVMAVILGGVVHGLTHELEAPRPVEGLAPRRLSLDGSSPPQQWLVPAPPVLSSARPAGMIGSSLSQADDGDNDAAADDDEEDREVAVAFWEQQHRKLSEEARECPTMTSLGISDLLL